MLTVERGLITRNVRQFLRLNEVAPCPGREQSWDFCFNYFQGHPKPTQDLELSCLQLGYYLASWGMLRGSSYLLRKTNASHYVAAVRVIEAKNETMRGLDADNYIDPTARQAILDTYRLLDEALLPDGGAARTLVTKVMMGVWGLIPSYDTYFISAFRFLAVGRTEKAAFNCPNQQSLMLLSAFYRDHADEVDGLVDQLRTVEFATGQRTSQHFTRMKIIDMFGFQTGYFGPSKALALPALP